MGAFLLTDNREQYRYEPTLELFHEMGFSAPASLRVGGRTLYVFPKIATGESNIHTDGDWTIVSVGTPVYKGRDHAGSIKALLEDYKAGSLLYDRLIGQYTILICHSGTVEIIRDPSGSKHVFTDKGHHLLSSHMLPLCRCIEGPLHINRRAVYEKFLTGFIMPPNTLFEEVVQADKSVEETMNSAETGIRFVHRIAGGSAAHRSGKLSDCISEQADTLRSYFELLRESGRNGADIGLSGGYDSRLVLACLKKYTKGKLHLHSHSTENDHRNDLKIANQMAAYAGVPCHTVETKKLNHSDHTDDVLRKSVLYFDGRDSFSIGGCGEVYTAVYRAASTESTPFTLTGVGGELYRNVFDIGRRRIRFDRFMKNKVFSDAFFRAVSGSLYHDISTEITDRAAARLSVRKHDRQPKTIAHRYYCEIMMPDAQGNALDAYNQVSRCVAPFLEPGIIAKGYEAIPFHRSGGEFEGKLIRYIDPGLAAISSSYGYPVGQRPLRAKIKEGIRTFIPASVWNRLSALVYRKKDQNDDASILAEVYANNRTLESAYLFLVSLFPEISFPVLLRTRENIRKVQFIAMTFYYLKERISTQ